MIADSHPRESVCPRMKPHGVGKTGKKKAYDSVESRPILHLSHPQKLRLVFSITKLGKQSCCHKKYDLFHNSDKNYSTTGTSNRIVSP